MFGLEQEFRVCFINNRGQKCKEGGETSLMMVVRFGIGLRRHQRRFLVRQSILRRVIWWERGYEETGRVTRMRGFHSLFPHSRLFPWPSIHAHLAFYFTAPSIHLQYPLPETVNMTK